MGKSKFLLIGDDKNIDVPELPPLKDSGERSTYGTGAQRDNHTGKGRFDLISIQGILRLARHYERGNKKYGIIALNNTGDVLKWLLLNAKGVVRIYLCTQETGVVVVTKNGFEKTILNTSSVKEKVLNDGTKKIQMPFVKLLTKDCVIQNAENGIVKQNVTITYESWDSTNNCFNPSLVRKTENAQSAAETYQQSEQCISTTIIIQGEQGESFVVGATTVLECLEIMLTVLQEHYGISKTQRPIFYQNRDNISATIPTDRNWEKGIPISRYADAILRHMFKYIAGCDDEDHLAAVVWNAMCIMHHEDERPEMQDLPGWQGRTTKWIVPLDKGVDENYLLEKTE